MSPHQHRCTICGERFFPPWQSPMTDEDAVCAGCLPNVSGNTLEHPRVPGTPLTPRQRRALAARTMRWEEEALLERCPWLRGEEEA